MLVDSSTDEMPNCELTTQHQILSYLQSQSLIGDYRSHSAYESQGLNFVEEAILPVIEDIYKGFRQNFQFYMTPKHFKRSIMTSKEAGVYLREYL